MLFLKIYVTFVRREQKRMNKRENNMKRFLYLTVCLLILGEFYGCNGDVFVDDFRPSDSELALDGNGDVATIQFAAANWDWNALPERRSGSWPGTVGTEERKRWAAPGY